ncbi:MAG: OmpH family outer membrane protein [Bacteroidales bacterium]|nr:OmpH family outer membrane protein [Bacteroidales bacterium]
MKKVIGLLAVAAFFLLSGNAFAQNYKFGHINSDELFMLMPERSTVIEQLEALQTELQNTAEIMQVEYNNKLNDYTTELENMNTLVRQTKEEELVSLQQRMSTFQQNADKQIQQLQMELTQPILQRAEKAIKDVAKENKFTYIFDFARGPIIYFDETRSEDILPLVKAKLGIE